MQKSSLVPIQQLILTFTKLRLGCHRMTCSLGSTYLSRSAASRNFSHSIDVKLKRLSWLSKWPEIDNTGIRGFCSNAANSSALYVGIDKLEIICVATNLHYQVFLILTSTCLIPPAAGCTTDPLASARCFNDWKQETAEVSEYARDQKRLFSRVYPNEDAHFMVLVQCFLTGLWAPINQELLLRGTATMDKVYKGVTEVEYALQSGQETREVYAIQHLAEDKHLEQLS